MSAMTMDHLTRGPGHARVGTSNPQVVEGWYGQPYPRPLEPTREYIDILRAVIARGAGRLPRQALPAAAGRRDRAGQAAAFHPASVPDRDPDIPTFSVTTGLRHLDAVVDLIRA
jgi:Luciferase-like monooxygenase